MKIAYLIQYFGPPDNSFASARSFDFAIEWAKQGHSVWIICSDAYLIDKKKPILFDDLPITVSVIHQPYENHYSSLRRIWAFLGFALKSLLLLLSYPEKFDALYASSTPLSVGFVGWLQKWFTGKHWVLEIRDLWPDFPVHFLGLQKSVISKLLYFFETVFYRDAQSIICLSPEVKTRLITHKNVNEKNIFVIPNGFSERLNTELPPKKNLFIYEGALGKANGIPWLLQFFDALLHQSTQAEVVIIGFGAFSTRIKHWAEQHAQSSRIQFLGTLNRSQTQFYLDQAKFTLVTFSDFPILETTSPNKLFDSIPHKIRPITNVQGWITLLAMQVGGFYENNPINAATKAIKLLNEDFDTNHKINEQFNRSNLAKKALMVIHKCG